MNDKKKPQSKEPESKQETASAPAPAPQPTPAAWQYRPPAWKEPSANDFKRDLLAMLTEIKDIEEAMGLLIVRLLEDHNHQTQWIWWRDRLKRTDPDSQAWFGRMLKRLHLRGHGRYDGQQFTSNGRTF